MSSVVELLQTFNILITVKFSITNPLTESFKDLVAKMQAHQEAKPSVIIQRYRFNSCQRASSETAAEYIAALHKLAEHCDYGDTLNKCYVTDWCVVSPTL